MARRRSGDKIVCRYFSWILVRRGRFFQADGRSNPTNAGRHSIQTADRNEALRELRELDGKIAIEMGLAKAEDHPPKTCDAIRLEDGRDLYFEFLSRPRATGGTKESTRKRYRSIFGKFIPFAHRKGVKDWNEVTADLLNKYAAEIVHKVEYGTFYLELTTLKQTVGWLIKKKLLSPDRAIDLPLAKPQGTTTYCYTHAQVVAMCTHCHRREDLKWLEAVIVALATTGLRIGELVDLRWSNLQLNAIQPMIRLIDESTGKQPRNRKRQTTKSGKGRSLPLLTPLSAQLAQLSRHPDGYVFRGPDGGRLKYYRARKALICEVLKPLQAQFPTNDDEAGVGDGRLHSFRHYFCSLCVDRNIPMQVVMAWLGHQESRMIQHYYHLKDAESHRHGKEIDSFFQSSGMTERHTPPPETPGIEKPDLGQSEK
ncbi:MAG: tyrosine-type recombinase/integrase [Planctomycetota bacterium]